MVIVLAVGIAAIMIFGVSTAGRSLEDINERQTAEQATRSAKEN